MDAVNTANIGAVVSTCAEVADAVKPLPYVSMFDAKVEKNCKKILLFFFKAVYNLFITIDFKMH